MAAELSDNHDLFDALGAQGPELKARCAPKFEVLEATVDRLRERAVAAGGVRPDVTAHQVIGLVVGTCKLAQPGVEAGAGCRMLDVVFDGLRRQT